MSESSKEVVARAIAGRVVSGEVIGIGTGSTVDIAIRYIGERVRSEGLVVRAVVTSYESEWSCREHGIEVLSAGFDKQIAWAFDGADEVDAQRRLIKGKGAALLREKLLAVRAERFVVIVDESKVVAELGKACPIPVEVIPDVRTPVENALRRLGAKEITIRQAQSGKHGPVITERGNIILDAHFTPIDDTLEGEIKKIVGVIESGLFVGYASEVLVGGAGGMREL